MTLPNISGKQPPKKVAKPDDVDIKSFQPIGAPTQMGTLNIMIIGLGTDNKMYLWDTQNVGWFLI